MANMFFPWNIKYPNVNDEELNLDWLLKALQKAIKDINDFIGINTIKYADPILWDITRQYEANTIVVDGHSGNAFISTKAVPSGVHLNNSDYWTQIYNYADVVDTLREQIAYNEGESTTATRAYRPDDLVFTNGLLYRVIANMIAGDSFVVDSNVLKTTINDEILRIIVSINGLEELLEAEAAARAEADDTLQQHIDDEATAREEADTTLQDNIDAEALARDEAIAAETEAREEADNDIIDLINNLDINHVYNQSTPTSGVTTNIGLKAGTYNITSNTTINAQLVVPRGAIINVADGVTLTINGQILAGRYNIFNLNNSGNLVVSKNYQDFGYPEWLGAIANGSTDCTDAIQKCLDIFTNTILGSGTYITSSTLTITNKSHNLKGNSSYRNSNGSRIVLNSGNGVILDVGYTNAPDSINNYLSGVSISGIEFSHNSSNFTSGAASAGIRFRYVMHCSIADCNIINCGNGIHLICAVACYFNKIFIFSETLSTGTLTRTFDGIMINATVQANGLSNASLYFNQCMISTGGVVYGESYGIRGYGSGTISDINITQCEINKVAYGISLEGTNSENGSLDIIITNNVIDSVAIMGAIFTNMNKGALTFNNNYIALGEKIDNELQYGIELNNCCYYNVNDNQIIGTYANATQQIGILAINTYRSNINNNVIKDFLEGMYVNASNTLTLDNNVVCCLAKASGPNMIHLNNVTYSVLNPIIYNANATTATNGVLMESCTRDEVNITRIRIDHITNRINVGGTIPSEIGSISNNYITGQF